MDLGTVFYVAAFGLIVIGIAGIVLSRHLLRVLFAVSILEAGANLLLVISGFRPDGEAPIALDGVFPAVMVDPVPQALVLTSIVIGVGGLALALSIALRLHRRYATLDMAELRRRMAADIDREAGLEPESSHHLPGATAPATIDRGPQ
jgi:multisubunit Na+/H+ antiporter MnhC subunit